jgi:hypothetical protein
MVTLRGFAVRAVLDSRLSTVRSAGRVGLWEPRGLAGDCDRAADGWAGGPGAGESAGRWRRRQPAPLIRQSQTRQRAAWTRRMDASAVSIMRARVTSAPGHRAAACRRTAGSAKQRLPADRHVVTQVLAAGTDTAPKPVHTGISVTRSPVRHRPAPLVRTPLADSITSIGSG